MLLIMNFRVRLFSLLFIVCSRNELRFISDINLLFKNILVSDNYNNNYNLVRDDIYVKSLVLLMDIEDDVVISKDVARLFILYKIFRVQCFKSRYSISLKDQVL